MKLNTWKLLRYLREEFLVVLGTSSTEPVMPRMLEKAPGRRLQEKRGGAGVAHRLLVQPRRHGDLPLAGRRVHCPGLQHPDLSLTQIGGMLAIMLLSSGAAGVTGSGFVALASTLTVIHDIPWPALALLIGIDRFMSEARALTSLASNAVVTVVISLSENAC